MAITISCHDCGAQYMAGDELAGNRMSCRQCGASVLIETQPETGLPVKRRRVNLLGVLGAAIAVAGWFAGVYVCAIGAVLSALAMLRPRRGIALVGLTVGMAGGLWQVDLEGEVLEAGSVNSGERVGDQSPVLEAPPAVERRPTTLQEDFEGVAEGELPEGWTGSPLVSVRKSGGSAWLQNSGDGRAMVRTRSLRLRGEFEVEVGIWNTNPLSITLIREAGPTDSISLDWGGGVVRLGDQSASVPALEDWPQQLRLVRSGRVLKAIVGETDCGTAVVSEEQGFSGIEFELEGGQRLAAIDSVVVRELESGRATETESFAESFSGTPDGGIPTGWEAADCIGAVRGVLRASSPGVHRVSTPRLEMAEAFKLVVSAGVDERAIFAVILEGSGTSTDLVLRVVRHFGGARLSWTGAADVELHELRSVSTFTIVRDSDVWRIELQGIDGSLFAHRIRGDWTFRGVSFVLAGGEQRSRLCSVSLGPAESESVARREIVEEPIVIAGQDEERELEAEREAVVRGPEETGPTADDLSGIWVGTSGSLKFDDQGERIAVRLDQSDVYSAVDGVLVRDGSELRAERWLVTFKSDRLQRPRRVSMQATIVDATHLDYETEAVEYVVRRGREFEVRRAAVRGDLRRLEETVERAE